MARRLLSLAALLALATPAAAGASSASVAGGALTITAGARERNDMGIEQRADGYFVQDNNADVIPGAGCVEGTDMYGNQGALCNGVASITVDLRDRDDALRPIGTLDAPISYSGGVGTDLILYPGPSTGFSLSGDAVANDGPSGKDNVAPDVERLYGTPFADSLSAGVNGAELVAGGGDDTLNGGPRNDR